MQAKPNLAEQCCYWGYSTPLRGEVWLSINTILLALTFSFPGSYILLTSSVLGSLFVTVLRSLPDSKHSAVPPNPLLIGICHSFGEIRPWYLSWLLTGNPSAFCLRTSRHWILSELILIELFRIPLGMSNHTQTIWLMVMLPLVQSNSNSLA